MDGQCLINCPNGYFELMNDTVDVGQSLQTTDELISNQISSDNAYDDKNLVTLVDNTVSRIVSRMISSSDLPASASRYCQKCHMSCLQCVSGKADDCTSCHPGLYLSNGYCVQQCNITLVLSFLKNK